MRIYFYTYKKNYISIENPHNLHNGCIIPLCARKPNEYQNHLLVHWGCLQTCSQIHWAIFFKSTKKLCGFLSKPHPSTFKWSSPLSGMFSGFGSQCGTYISQNHTIFFDHLSFTHHVKVHTYSLISHIPYPHKNYQKQIREHDGCTSIDTRRHISCGFAYGFMFTGTQRTQYLPVRLEFSLLPNHNR